MKAWAKLSILFGSHFVRPAFSNAAAAAHPAAGHTPAFLEENLNGGAICGLDSADAIDNLLDSAVFLWAAADRCGQPGAAVKCEIDIASAIEALNGMANAIVTTVSNCGLIKTKHKLCGMTVSDLTKDISGLAAASGGLADKCARVGKAGGHEEHAHSHRRLTDAESARASMQRLTTATCVVDMKGSFRSLYEVLESTMSIDKHCLHKKGGCISNTLQVVSAVSSLGGYLAGSVGHCSVGHEIGAECSSQVMSMIHYLDSIAQTGTRMAQVCKAGSHGHALHKLFLEDSPVAPDDTLMYICGVLLGVIPIAAVLSFFVGKRSASGRPGTVVRELESLVPVDDQE